MLVSEDQAKWNSNYVSKKQPASQEMEWVCRQPGSASAASFRGAARVGEGLWPEAVCVVKGLVCPTRCP